MLVRPTRLLRPLLVAAMALAPLTVTTATPATSATTAAATRAAVAAAAPLATTTNGCVASVPEPGTTAPVRICWTVFRPAGATRRDPVPMVMHGHGWGGSRFTEPSEAADLLRAGFGVISFDQRGWGQSGGFAHLMDPAYEGQDVRRLVDLVARLPWVVKDGPRDPRIGAYGGSYGGGYQFVGAFSEIRATGRTRFDALVPEITWNRLGSSLFPSGVARTEWIAALYALSLPSNVLPPVITQGLLRALATGNVPASVLRYVERSGPGWYVDRGLRLDVPVLFGQGETDSLFPLQEGLRNYDTALTRRARKQSVFVGYNAGHVLPTLLPLGSNPFDPSTLPYSAAADPCSRRLTGGGDFGTMRLRFLREHLLGREAGLRGEGGYHLATAAGRCVSVPSIRPTTERRVGDVLTTVGLGVPMSVPVARGPISVAGTSRIDATVTGTSPDNRVLVALSIGRTPLDARIVQNNMLPLRQLGTGTKRRTGVVLPSVAVDVPRGQNLYLTVSPISDMTLGFGSRVVGALSLRDVVVHLPVTRR